MIIFGTTGITSIRQKGSFHCPSCGAGAPFERKGVRRFFTLFFVPLIPLHQVADFIECKRCGGTFKPEVLTWNGTVPGQIPPPLPQLQEVHQLRPSIHPVTGMPLVPPVVPAPHGSGTVLSYQSNGIASASMVLGILGLLTSFLFCPGFIFAPLSLVFGFIALKRVKNGGGLVGGKGPARVGIACSVVALLISCVMTAIVMTHEPDASDKARSAMNAAANDLTRSSSIPAHGNTAEARKLATAFASTITSLDAVSFTSTKSNSKKSSYAVHCELREGKCAFIVYVPEYRKFEESAKKSLEEMAWLAAHMVPSTPAIPPGTPLCVALKGDIVFGSVMIGKTGEKKPGETGKDESLIEPFFAQTQMPTGPKPAPAPQAVEKDEP